MKKLLLLSGKGGTGKTTVACALIRLSQAQAYADCDIDAPNLHLTMTPAAPPAREAYYGMGKARIDPERCIRCGRCRSECRFEAVRLSGGDYHVDPFACEGCGLCLAVVRPGPLQSSRTLRAS
jgi:MinD superfamily P-loop ATPase